MVPSNGLDRVSLWIKPGDLALYSHLVDVIQREAGREETILAIPMSPELYFLSRRRNPLRFSNFAIGLTDDDDVEAVVDALSRAPPKLVVYRPDDIYNTTSTVRLMDFVTKRYVLVETYGGFEVYRHGTGVTLSPRQ